MKKIISLVITAIMLVGILNPINAAAEVKTNISLEKAITIAKTTFNLTTEGYELNYQYYENQNGKNLWRLSWNKDKEPSSNISVAVDSDTGDVISMNRWDSSNIVPSKIPVYSKDQALKSAQEIAKKIQPANFEQTKLYENKSNIVEPYYTSNDSYSFNFIRVVNGIGMPDNGIRITLDKNTLKMTNYTFDWDKGPFPDATKAINIDEAKKIFGEKLGIELSYRLIYDYTKKTETPILVYALKGSNSPIDALTGELIENSLIRYGLDKSENTASSPLADGGGLTPEEQSTVDSNDKLISKEAAIEIIKKYVKQASSYKFENANLYTNKIRKTASWHLSWTLDNGKDKSKSYLSAQVNAQTSELISFYLSGEEFNSNEKTPPKYTQAQAKDIAEKFIKSQQPEKFAASEYRENKYADEYIDNYPTYYSYSYINKQNEALCPFNNFNVNVNSQTGEIQSYGMEWVDVKLPSTDGAMTLENAYKALYSNLDFSMQYVRNYDYSKGSNTTPVIKLAYVLENFSGMIDSKNGSVLDYSGKQIKEAKKIEFSDIKGHSAEKDIQLLIEMGILDDESESFNPDSKLLQKDFVKMIVRAVEPYSYTYGTTDDSKDEYDKYYKIAIQRKIISEKEQLPNAQISKQIAAKMLLRALNVGFIGDLSNIYVLSYKDANLVGTQYKGYVAIASELGLVLPEKDYFNPRRHVLRGEAASMLVNLLKVDVNIKE